MCILQSIKLNTSSSQKKNLNTRKTFKVYTNNSMQVPIHEKMWKNERKEGEKKNTIGSAIQVKVKDVHGGDWFGWGECPHLISLDSLGHQRE